MHVTCPRGKGPLSESLIADSNSLIGKWLRPQFVLIKSVNDFIVGTQNFNMISNYYYFFTYTKRWVFHKDTICNASTGIQQDVFLFAITFKK